MKNDAKLGMLAGVLGVIVAAVLFAKAPPPPDPTHSGANADPPAKEKPAQPAPATSTANTPAGPVEANTAALPTTPVGRTRKDVDAQPTSRPAGTDEEP
jgi:hypothetical protein